MDIIVLDTSAIISDISCLKGYPDQRLIVPFGVLSELNTFKHEANSARGKAARDALRFMEEARALGSLSEGVPLESGALLSVVGLGEGLSPNVVDDEIVLLAREHGASVLSNDLALRVRASAMGVDATSTQDGADRTTEESFDFLDGYEEVFVDPSMVDALYQCGVILTDTVYPENRYFVIRSAINPKHSALARYRDGQFHRIKDERLVAWGVNPKNVEQKFAMDLLLDDSVQGVFLIGGAGTGKTYLALAAALEKVLEQEIYDAIIISKPINPIKGQDLGFLPGTQDEKIGPVYANLYSHLVDLTEEKFIKALLEKKTKIIMEPLAFIRGKSYKKSLILIDEAQNLTRDDIRTIVTRLGEGCKIILTGDPSQIDVPKLAPTECGIVVAADRLGDSPLTGVITMKHCLRSQLAKRAIELL